MMAEDALPRRAPGVVLRPQTWRGRRIYAVRDPEGRRYFHLGEREGWLLDRLDEARRPDDLRVGFREAFGEDVDPAWLKDTLAIFAREGLLEGQEGER